MALTNPKRPNLLVVLVDQMRYMAMGLAGDGQARTPHLDAFAAQGASMDLAVSNSPVCTPARACLLTGRYPLAHTTITNNSMLPPDMPSIGKMLRSEGYATGYIGKWHLAGEGYIGKTEYNGGHAGWIPPGEMRHGFDYWAVHHCSHDYTHAFYYRDEPEPIHIDGWEPDAQTDLAIDFIEQRRDKPDPFFLTISWGTPHTPFISPLEFREMFDADLLCLRDNVETDNLFDRQTENPEKVLREHTANYYAAIANIDWNFGRLLDTLDVQGLAADTVVVFTSDHGEMLGSHGHMHKLQTWDESIRIPFLVRYPDHVPGGLRSGAPFGLADVLPSLFSLMGVDIPDVGIEGHDFARTWRGEAQDTPESTLLIWPCDALTWGKVWTDVAQYRGSGFTPGFARPYRGIRTRTHTYVRDRQGPWFLYDNFADPLQMRNLVETDGPGAVPEELEHMLQDWLRRTGDTFEDTSFYRDNIDLETGLAMDASRFRSLS